MPRLETLAPLVLRLGMSILFLWFGASQIIDTETWTGWVPQWTTALTGLSAYEIALFNGILEVVGGLALAAGLLTRVVALVLALHVFAIAFSIGYTAIGVRDFCFAIATLSVALYGPDRYCFDKTLWR